MMHYIVLILFMNNGDGVEPTWKISFYEFIGHIYLLHKSE